MCDYFDDVEQLKGFGDANKESLGELVWAVFEHWAWKHDYNNAVVSVRTGGFLTKSQKEWTRRVGNERHLVCIEVRAVVPYALRVDQNVQVPVLTAAMCRANSCCDGAGTGWGCCPFMCVWGDRCPFHRQ